MSIKSELIFSSAVLFAGVCLCLHYAPLFGEGASPQAPDSSAASDEAPYGEDGRLEDGWFAIESSYFVIYCDQTVDLQTVARNLNRRGLFAGALYGDEPDMTPSEEIAYKLDSILKRVKEILDMYPRIPELRIKIFKDRDELSAEYFKIFNVEKKFKAFYIYKYNTIYISAEDISDSVIAHEMGHAVVDHYFSVIPPEKIRELLASYVDLHLEEE